jgi:hypothetical protein
MSDGGRDDGAGTRTPYGVHGHISEPVMTLFPMILNDDKVSDIFCNRFQRAMDELEAGTKIPDKGKSVSDAVINTFKKEVLKMWPVFVDARASQAYGAGLTRMTRGEEIEHEAAVDDILTSKNPFTQVTEAERQQLLFHDETNGGGKDTDRRKELKAIVDSDRDTPAFYKPFHTSEISFALK